MNEIFQEKYVFLDQELDSKEAVFKFIAQQAKSLGIAKKEKAILDGLTNRESDGTMAFKNGIAIPHVRAKQITSPAVLAIRLKQSFDWGDDKHQQVHLIFAVLSPMKAPAGFEHIDIIGQLATNLTSTGFCQAVEQAADAQSVVALLNQKPVIDQAHFEAMLVKNPIKPVDGAKKQKILFLSACQEGLVNVRLANQQMMEAIEPTGNDLRIETHDAYEVERPFNASQIKQANLIIVAADQEVDLSRFAGKKVYQTSTSAVINDAQKVLGEALTHAKVYKMKQSPINKDFDEITLKAPKEKKPNVLDHIMAGISYMLPALVLGGILVAFSLGISTQVAGHKIDSPKEIYGDFGFLNVMFVIGQAAMALTAPLFAAYIANSIAGKSAIVPAMVAAFVANHKENIYLYNGMTTDDIVPLGFIGAIIAGLCVGYFVRWMLTWKVPKTIEPIMPILIIPLIAGLGMSLIFVYAIGTPLSYVINKVAKGISKIYGGDVTWVVSMLVGALLGTMCVFDMGGPINKIAFIAAVTSLDQKIAQPMGAIAVACAIPPIAVGITTLLIPRAFSKEERNLGIAAIIMGSVGITEGVLPFALKDPKRIIICNVLGGMIGGGIAGALQIEDLAAHGGPIVALLGGIEYGAQTAYFFIALGGGVLVESLVYTFWILATLGQPGSLREFHFQSLNKINGEYDEKVAMIKEQKHQLKEQRNAQIKDAKKLQENVEPIKIDYAKRIKALDGQLKQLTAQVKKDRKTLNVAFKALEPKEKLLVKESHKAVEVYDKEEKARLAKELKELEAKRNQAKKIEVKLERKEKLASWDAKIEEAKDNAKKRMDEYASTYRKPIVDQYRQQMAPILG